MSISTATLITYSAIALVVIIVLRAGSSVVLAPYNAIRRGKDELNLFGGRLKLILWEPNEGIVVLRNKQIHFTDVEGTGGRKFIFPVMGDEIRARVPLAIRLLIWEDEEVLTRESLQAHIRVAIWWKVEDIIKYTFDIDREIHLGKDHSDVGVVEASETWVRALAESTMRVLVSRASIAQLISAAATKYLEVANQMEEREVLELDSVSTIAETIAARLEDELQSKASRYGISIDRVEIQEVRMPVEVQKAVNRVWTAFLKPVQTEQEARARQIELQAAADVLGADAVALNELLKNFQGSDFYTVPPFLQTMFGMVDSKAQAAVPGPDAPEFADSDPNMLGSGKSPEVDGGAKEEFDERRSEVPADKEEGIAADGGDEDGPANKEAADSEDAEEGADEKDKVEE